MEMTERPFFTVVTSTFNATDTIERYLDSVKDQTFKDLEHIIVDGASTDGTAEILSSRKDLFSAYISEPDTGIFNAWNKALRYARGEWILFVGADDILADREVLSDVAIFIRDRKVLSGIVYGDIIHVHKGSYKFLKRSSVLPEDICTRPPLKLRPILPPHPSVFHNRSLFPKYGIFDESLKITGDTEFMLRVLCIGKEEVMRMPRVITMMTQGGVSSANRAESAYEEIKLMEHLKIKVSLGARGLALLKASCRIIWEKTISSFLDSTVKQ